MAPPVSLSRRLGTFWFSGRHFVIASGRHFVIGKFQCLSMY